MYEAIVTPIINVKPIEGAKTIATGQALGYTVVVSNTTRDGDLGILFPPEGELSHEFLHHNSLYRAGKGENKDSTKNGFFESTRRVRAQKFMKVKSEGFFCTPEMLSYTGVDQRILTPGFRFSELNGQLVCQKYVSKATRQAIARAAKQGKRHLEVPMFKQHFETDQLRYNLDRIPVGALLTVTCKLHGTSGRTGLLLVPQKLSNFKRWWNDKFSKFYEFKPSYSWTLVSGTRRVILDPEVGDTYYSGKQFRFMIHEELETKGFRKGETVYYEIVGYDDDGGLIMPSHGIEEKELKKEFGDHMTYRYGCKSLVELAQTDPAGSELPWKIFVYRITQTNEDGDSIELSWSQVKNRCKQLNLTPVPDVHQYLYNGNKEELLELCKKYGNSRSVVDPTHIEEGVCVRVEHEELTSIYKMKSFWFSVLEGIRVSDDSYIDPEDIS